MSPMSGDPRDSRLKENVMTSVAPECPRYWEFSFAIARVPRKVTDTIAFRTRSDRSVPVTSSRTRDFCRGRRRSVVDTSTLIA
jgi:hypothetical protein